MIDTHDPREGASAAVRVWRGFRASTLTIDQFCAKLGNVFIPATVKMQIDAGLQAYVPTIPAGLPEKPDNVPDETAILFWESQETYWNAFTTLAVRTYTLTHGGVYATDKPRSRADFPVQFTGTLAPDEPVYLFDKVADWMHGSVAHVVGARKDDEDTSAFLSAAAEALSQIEKTIPLDGAIACAGNDFLIYWELRPAASGSGILPTGAPIVEDILGWYQSFTPAPTFLPVGLWDQWAGMDVRSGNSFNMQFSRRSIPK